MASPRPTQVVPAFTYVWGRWHRFTEQRQPLLGEHRVLSPDPHSPGVPASPGAMGHRHLELAQMRHGGSSTVTGETAAAEGGALQSLHRPSDFPAMLP